MQAAIVLGVVVLALVLFWKEWVPIEVTSLLVVFLLAVTGVLEPREAFAGFANDTVIFIFALLAMTQGLAATGVVRALGAQLGFLARLGPTAFLVGMMIAVAFFSAFVSNTVTVAAFLPVVLSAAERAGLSPRRALMPMSFASMLGGTILLFGTSTNLVMSEVMQRAGLGAIGVTELAPVGLVVTVVGVALVALLAPRLLRGDGDAPDEELVARREYLAELAVPAGSPHVGRELADVAQELGARPVGVVRREGGGPPAPGVRVAPDDRVLVEGEAADIVGAADAVGVEHPAASAARPARGQEEGALVVVEAVVPPGSRLAGRSSEEARLAERLGVELLAVHRRPQAQHQTRRRLLGHAALAPGMEALPVAVGDVLLLRARRERIRALAAQGTLLVLTGFEHDPPRRRKAVLAVALFLGALVLGSAKVLPMAVAGLGGLLVMVLTGCVDGRRVFDIDWRVVLLIGSMLALGLAMEQSGAGALVGAGVAQVATLGGPRAVLVVLTVVTVLLSAPMSNQAAALVVFPVAVSAAGHLGVDPRPLAIAVTFAGSCSFMTPLEPASLLVMGAGRYRFSDFVRTGGPLTLAIVLLVALLVPIVWPLSPR